MSDAERRCFFVRSFSHDVVDQLHHSRPKLENFRIDIAVEHPARRGELRAIRETLVETSSEFTWLPADLLDEMGVVRETTRPFIVAEGRVLERSMGMAILHAANEQTPDWVVFAEPNDFVLLGAHSLVGMNLRFDTEANRLVWAGPIITAAA